MPDVYATIADIDVATQKRLADIRWRLRAAATAQQRDARLVLSEIDFGARRSEIGCGTGSVTRVLADRPDVTEAVGIDRLPVFISKARELATASANLTFEAG